MKANKLNQLAMGVILTVGGTWPSQWRYTVKTN